MTKYRNIFFDLDDTLWAFSENSRDSFEEVYNKSDFNEYFDSFEHYYELYQEKNVVLWQEYSKGNITKAELNRQRFLYPLRMAGVDDPELSERFASDFFASVPTKKKLMPHATEVLEYLKPRYNLYILSNGFHELQASKMKSSGIDGYFKKVILSDDIGVLKPYPEIFHFALSATQSEFKNSLMIGDNWHADIAGAKAAGIDQMYYNFTDQKDLPFRPTYEIKTLAEIMDIL